jgi:hypothetical protein
MRGFRVTVVAAAFSVLAVGCASDSDSPGSGTATTTAPAPESITTAPSATAAGLRQIAVVVAQVAAAGDAKDQASSLAEQIEPIWQKIEGTVKSNDQNSYLAFEDSFALISTGAEAGDTAKVGQGVAGVTKAIAEYLAKYPG